MSRISREAAPDRRQHAERQHIHLEQAEVVQIILVPLDDRALRHGRILDRHQHGQRLARDHEAADMLGQMARQTDQLPGQCNEPPHHGDSGIKPASRIRIRHRIPPVRPGQRLVRSAPPQTQRLGPHRGSRCAAIADHRGRQCGPLATVLGVDVLDDFLAPLVLEIHIDVRWLVALARDEASEQHLHRGRIDSVMCQAIADDGVGRRAASLAEDAAAARETHDVVHGQKKAS
jgi:hypothetical protein